MNIELWQYIDEDATPAEIATGILTLVDNFLVNKTMTDEQKKKVARLRAYIDINLKDL